MLGSTPPVRIEFWDGSVVESDGPPGRGGPPGTLRVNSPDAIRRLLWMPNQLGLGRAYVAGDLDAEGDFIAMVEALRDVTAEDLRFRSRAVIEAIAAAQRAGVIGRPLPPPPQEARLEGRRHSLRRDSRAISHHYDVGNDFYRLVLGESMTYSCARFVDDGTSLDDAQAAKHDLVARKLGPRPARGHAAARRRLRLGIDGDPRRVALRRRRRSASRSAASRPSWPGKRVGEAGVGDQVEIRLQDYRELGDERFDAISSIGMAEHVGAQAHRRVLRHPAHARCVPTGRLLNHAISSVGGSKLGRRSFVGRYVFPDGELLDVGDTVLAMERAGFEVRDVESLREHYAKTLRAWVANLEANWDAAVAAVRHRPRPDLAAVHGRLGGRVHRRRHQHPPGARRRADGDRRERDAADPRQLDLAVRD